jgi:hypothetical protein
VKHWAPSSGPHGPSGVSSGRLFVTVTPRGRAILRGGTESARTAPHRQAVNGLKHAAREQSSVRGAFSTRRITVTSEASAKIDAVARTKT